MFQVLTSQMVGWDFALQAFVLNVPFVLEAEIALFLNFLVAQVSQQAELIRHFELAEKAVAATKVQAEKVVAATKAQAEKAVAVTTAQAEKASAAAFNKPTMAR